MAFDSTDDRIFVGRSDGTVSVIDAKKDSFLTTSIAIGAPVTSVAYDSKHNRIYAATALYVSVINASKMTIDTGIWICADQLAYDDSDDRMYVSCPAYNSILSINTVTKTVNAGYAALAYLTIPCTPSKIAFGKSKLWVWSMCVPNPMLFIVDGKTGTASAPIDPYAFQSAGLTVDPSTDSSYLIDGGGDTWVRDSTGATTKQLSTSGNSYLGWTFDPVNKTLYGIRDYFGSYASAENGTFIETYDSSTLGANAGKGLVDLANVDAMAVNSTDKKVYVLGTGNSIFVVW